MTTTAPSLELTHFQYSVDADGVALVLIDRDGEAMNTMSPDLMCWPAAEMRPTSIAVSGSIPARLTTAASPMTWSRPISSVV